METVDDEYVLTDNSATIKGGSIGGVIGTAVGAAAVMAASRRYHSFRALTVPFRAFLVASTGTFVGMSSRTVLCSGNMDSDHCLAVIAADRASGAARPARSVRDSGDEVSAFRQALPGPGPSLRNSLGRLSRVDIGSPMHD